VKLIEYEKNKQAMARAAELAMLRRIMSHNTGYAIQAAGFWLKLWRRTRSVLMGRPRKRAAA